MARQTPRRKGRPPANWLTPDALAALATGTAVSIETIGRHEPRTVGRITANTSRTVSLTTAAGEPFDLDVTRIKRGRIIASLYEPGDPVLCRHIPATDWRGGVVRCDGIDVLVEQINGTFDWFTEDELEPADARDETVPATPRGPVPARSR